MFSLQIKDIEVLNCEYGKNTINLEQFAIDICNHFMTTFCQVAYVKTYVQEVPWQRLHEDGVPHIHSFICVPDGIRFCEAEQCRNGPLVVFAGIKDLKLMKTTQSGFEGFYKNEHTTLPERHDRILCGELFCKWSYGECKDFDFDCIWKKIRECILEAFAGPPDCGEYSPSYQKTVNCIQMLVLSRLLWLPARKIGLFHRWSIVCLCSSLPPKSCDSATVPSYPFPPSGGHYRSTFTCDNVSIYHCCS
uniref:Uricase n=1 Tax=Catharus ustulatus TaxID=91951 RepID=A0A8C3XYP0_CATUS